MLSPAQILFFDEVGLAVTTPPIILMAKLSVAEQPLLLSSTSKVRIEVFERATVEVLAEELFITKLSGVQL